MLANTFLGTQNQPKDPKGMATNHAVRLGRVGQRPQNVEDLRVE